jgi:hypothetical protein
MREREFTVLADEFSLGATTYPGLSYLDRTIQACNSVLQSAELVAGHHWAGTSVPLCFRSNEDGLEGIQSVFI